MAQGNSVNLKMKVDTTELKSGLQLAERSARSAAAAISGAYRKAGMDSSAAMKKAWEEVNAALKNGSTLVINGVETIIKKNEEVIKQKGKLGGVFDKLGISAEEAGEKTDKAKIRIKAGLADIKAGIDLTSTALREMLAVAKSGVSYVAQMDSYQRSFKVMTGSAEKAAEMMQRLRTLGAETPFETSDLVKTTQLLMQYGFQADEAIDRLTMLGDIAQGDAQAMNSVAMGYAQMSSAGKVNLQDIKQMINAGFNPLQEISERTGESMASLYDRISKGTMAVDEITESMRMATSEGGKFFGSMEEQSKSLNGQISTLQDNAMELLGSLTGGLASDMATEYVPLINSWIGELQAAFEKGGYDGLLKTASSLAPEMLSLMTGNLEDGFAVLTKRLPKLAQMLLNAFPGALKSASNLLPQITTVLFEISAEIVNGLVFMLPELAPIVGQGIIEMIAAGLSGAAAVAEALWDGVDQALHRGKTKVLGHWVDDTEIAKFNFDMEFEIDDGGAPSEIATAYSNIQAALKGGPLTDEQKTEILGMIGEDAGAIKKKLKDFGLSDTEAEELAGQVSEIGKPIVEALNGLDIAVDGATVMRWFAAADGSRIALIAAAKSAGLEDADIDEILGVYGQMTGRLESETPSVAETIFKALTDGLADDEETVGGLKDQVKTYTDGLLKDATDGMKAAIDALDPNDPEYTRKVAAIKKDYEETVAQIGQLKDNMNSYIDSYAGATTGTVMAASEQIAEMERLSKELEEKTGIARDTMNEQGERAFKITRSGAVTDEETISMAIKFKNSEFKLDAQEAEDAYAKARDELQRQFDEGEIEQGEYDIRMTEEQGKLAAAKETAKQAYERALSEIFAGIGESEGLGEAIDKAAVTKAMAEKVSEIAEGLAESEDLTAPVGDALGEDVTQYLANRLKLPPEAIKASTKQDALMMINQLAYDLESASGQQMTDVMQSKVGAAFEAALESGLLEGTNYNTDESAGQFAAILSGIASTGAEQSIPDVQAASTTVIEAATGAMADYDGAADSGSETINGLIYALAKGEDRAYKAGVAAARAFENGYNDTAEIHSPSRRARRSGHNSMDGLILGYKDKLREALRTVRYISGQMMTAADFVGTSKLTLPDMTAQLIAAANNNETTPVLLDGQQIAEIQSKNNSHAIAFDNGQQAWAVGGA